MLAYFSPLSFNFPDLMCKFCAVLSLGLGLGLVHFLHSANTSALEKVAFLALQLRCDFSHFGSQHRPQHRTGDCHDETVLLVDNISEFDFLHSLWILSSAFT